MTISATAQGLRPGVCTSTSRPSAPFDGQVIYETDTDRVAVYDATAWVYKTPASTAGSVLQVVSTTKTDTFTTTGTSPTDITGLSATITPKFSTSKILVIVTITGMSAVGVNDAFVRIVRDSTAIAIGDAAGSRQRASATLNKLAGGSMFEAVVSHFDSPTSTSALTYKSQIWAFTGTVYVNRTETDSDSASYPRTISSITLMEIAQ